MRKTVCFILSLSMLLSLILASVVLARFKGDVNDDDEVNNKDVVVLFRYVSSSEERDDESVYDYNDDGSVDNKDVVALFRFVSSGEEPYIPTDDSYFDFALLDDGTYEIKAKDNNNLPVEIVIPKIHKGKPVTVIAFDAFSESDIESIVIGEGVILIEDCAFWKCSKMKSVTMPSSLHTIGEEVFKGCNSLMSATFGDPDGWDKFSKSYLSNTVAAAEALKAELEIWIHHIWENQEISTELTCTQDGYGNHTCSVCGLYEEYHMLATGHDFDENDVCKKCGEPYTPTDDSYFDFRRLDDGTYEIKKKEGVNLPSYVILPKTHNNKVITSIGEYAFYNCSSITNMMIPKGIVSISDSAFCGCANLTSVSIPDSVTLICNSVFENCSNLENLNVPDSVTSIGDYAFCRCKKLKIMIIPHSVTSIGNRVFLDCWNLKNVIMLDGIVEIGDYALSGCANLTSVSIPDSVTSIGDYAFSSCGKLKDVKIPDNVISFGCGAFYNCFNLTSVTISNGVMKIGERAFSGCRNLTSVTMLDGITEICEAAFSDCSSLTSLTIPDGITLIDDQAFTGCNNLVSIKIPNSVTSLGDSAFSCCRNLVDIIYTGTMNQWDFISKGRNWNSDSGNFTIHCTDGDLGKYD